MFPVCEMSRKGVLENNSGRILIGVTLSQQMGHRLITPVRVPSMAEGCPRAGVTKPCQVALT